MQWVGTALGPGGIDGGGRCDDFAVGFVKIEANQLGKVIVLRITTDAVFSNLENCHINHSF